MDCSTPGFSVHHQLLELAQTHVHWVGDAIQPSHPLLSSSAFNLSQHEGLFKWVSSSHQVAKVLQFQLQHQSFQWIFNDWFPLELTGWISLLSKGLSKSLPQHHSSKASILWQLVGGLSFSPVSLLVGLSPGLLELSSCTVAGFPSQRNWGEKLQGFQTSLRIYAPPFSSQSIPPTDQLWLTRLLDQVRVTEGILEVGYHVLYVGVPCFYNVIYPGALSSSLQRKLPNYKAITIITVYPMTGCTIALLIDMYCYIDLVCSLLLWEITHQWTTWHLCLFLSVQV